MWDIQLHYDAARADETKKMFAAARRLEQTDVDTGPDQGWDPDDEFPDDDLDGDFPDDDDTDYDSDDGESYGEDGDVF
ncbi:MAG: hypothetical protein J4432_03825 [DPANN group archaeon]|nr:hypothetical protein [DPANN group archaeon]